MPSPLIFVLSPPAALPLAESSMQELQAAQGQGPRGAFALRLFTQDPQQPLDLAHLSVDGKLPADTPRQRYGCRRITDAVVPHFEPHQNWLGIYQATAEDAAVLRCLDRLPLREANNETCWFYPTQDGHYLSWERGVRITLSPGRIAEGPDTLPPGSYERSKISVLWSLLGDDASLRCVGLTYEGQRIEWPLVAMTPEAVATWSSFCVDSQADVSPVITDTRTVFATDS